MSNAQRRLPSPPISNPHSPQQAMPSQRQPPTHSQPLLPSSSANILQYKLHLPFQRRCCTPIFNQFHWHKDVRRWEMMGGGRWKGTGRTVLASPLNKRTKNCDGWCHKSKAALRTHRKSSLHVIDRFCDFRQNDV